MLLANVTDDSGFLALVDPAAYRGYVAEDWDIGRLLERFSFEMQAHHLLIWGTGSEGQWNVEVSFSREARPTLREVTGGIVCSSGKLLLTNYESLTMAAQLDDVHLPEHHQVEQMFDAPPGSYVCRVLQLSHVDGHTEGETSVDFLLELTAGAQLPEAWSRIPWTDDDLYVGLTGSEV